MMNRDKYRLLKQQLTIIETLRLNQAVSIDGKTFDGKTAETLVKTLLDSIFLDFTIPSGVLDSKKNPKELLELHKAVTELCDGDFKLIGHRYDLKKLSELIYRYPDIKEFFRLAKMTPDRNPDATPKFFVDQLMIKVEGLLELIRCNGSVTGEPSVSLQVVLILVNTVELIDSVFYVLNLREGK